MDLPESKQKVNTIGILFIFSFLLFPTIHAGKSYMTFLFRTWYIWVRLLNSKLLQKILALIVIIDTITKIENRAGFSFGFFSPISVAIQRIRTQSTLVRGVFNKFPDFFVQAFKIVVDSWKFSILLPFILWDDWPIFMTSGSNEQLQQQLEYTLLKPDCHSSWISKMQSGREDTLEERYTI